MNYKETKSVIDFKEKTNPEKQQLHQFLLQNDIQFVRNASGDFDAVIRMVTPSEEQVEIQSFYQRITGRSNNRKSISHQQSKKTFTDISTSESSIGKLQRSRKTGSMMELLSGKDKLNRSINRNEPPKTQLSSTRVEPQKEILNKEQSRFTSDFNDRWRLSKLKNLPSSSHRQVMQQSSQKQKQKSQQTHLGSLQTLTFTSPTEDIKLQSAIKPPINKYHNYPSVNLVNPRKQNLTQETESSKCSQTVLLQYQQLGQVHAPVEEKRKLIQLRKILPDEILNSEGLEKGESSQQTFSLSLLDDCQSNGSSNNNSSAKLLIPSLKNQEISISSSKATIQKDNGSNNNESQLAKSILNGCQTTVQSELFQTPSGKKMTEMAKENKFGIGQSSQFTLNDRAISSQKKEKNNSKTVSMKESSFNDRISYLKSARFSAKNSAKLSSAVPFKSSHDYSPILDLPNSDKQNNFLNIHQESSQQEQSHHQNDSTSNLDGISNSLNHEEEQQLKMELIKQQNYEQQQFSNSPPSPFEQEYFSFTSSPNKFSPAKMITSPYSNILKDDPWLEVLKNELSPHPAEIENKKDIDFQVFNQEVNLKQLSSSELVQYYRFVMEKARLQSICPAPQKYSVGSYRERVQ